MHIIIKVLVSKLKNFWEKIFFLPISLLKLRILNQAVILSSFLGCLTISYDVYKWLLISFGAPSSTPIILSIVSSFLLTAKVKFLFEKLIENYYTGSLKSIFFLTQLINPFLNKNNLNEIIYELQELPKVNPYSSEHKLLSDTLNNESFWDKLLLENLENSTQIKDLYTQWQQLHEFSVSSTDDLIQKIQIQIPWLESKIKLSIDFNKSSLITHDFSSFLFSGLLTQQRNKQIDFLDNALNKVILIKSKITDNLYKRYFIMHQQKNTDDIINYFIKSINTLVMTDKQLPQLQCYSKAMPAEYQKILFDYLKLGTLKELPLGLDFAVRYIPVKPIICEQDLQQQENNLKSELQLIQFKLRYNSSYPRLQQWFQELINLKLKFSQKISFIFNYFLETFFDNYFFKENLLKLKIFFIAIIYLFFIFRVGFSLATILTSTLLLAPKGLKLLLGFSKICNWLLTRKLNAKHCLIQEVSNTLILNQQYIGNCLSLGVIELKGFNAINILKNAKRKITGINLTIDWLKKTNNAESLIENNFCSPEIINKLILRLELQIKTIDFCLLSISRKINDNIANDLMKIQWEQGKYIPEISQKQILNLQSYIQATSPQSYLLEFVEACNFVNKFKKSLLETSFLGGRADPCLNKIPMGQYAKDEKSLKTMLFFVDYYHSNQLQAKACMDIIKLLQGKIILDLDAVIKKVKLFEPTNIELFVQAIQLHLFQTYKGNYKIIPLLSLEQKQQIKKSALYYQPRFEDAKQKIKSIINYINQTSDFNSNLKSNIIAKNLASKEAFALVQLDAAVDIIDNNEHRQASIAKQLLNLLDNFNGDSKTYLELLKILPSAYYNRYIKDFAKKIFLKKLHNFTEKRLHEVTFTQEDFYVLSSAELYLTEDDIYDESLNDQLYADQLFWDSPQSLTFSNKTLNFLKYCSDEGIISFEVISNYEEQFSTNENKLSSLSILENMDKVNSSNHIEHIESTSSISASNNIRNKYERRTFK
jgi:hypothetical protein